MPPCFKAYDIRGRVPDELDADLARRIGQAYARVIAPPGPVAVGEDIRLSSPGLARALVRGLNEAGVDTRSLGLCGTETVYHAASLEGMGGGIMVTASHNPMDYNGMKLVRAGAVPVSGDSGLADIGRLAASGEACARAGTPGEDRPLEVTEGYVQRILGFVERDRLQPLHLVVNAGNGAAGPTFDALAAHLPFRVTRIHHAPDGHFPNGIPNPLLPENREVTAHAVRVHGADLGIAWDGDFDRCFLFDENGGFIEGYYMVGLLAAQMLEKAPGGRIIHDPRLMWNTRDMVRAAGGVAVMSKTGHAFIKERMRREDAVYGGEMSAHHYFRGFSYCDSGMIPWLLAAERISITGRPLSALVAERQRAYPCSGEINFRVTDTDAVMARVRTAFAPQGPEVDETDGVSMAFTDWRFNLRSSNTEPVLRLNVETRGDPVLLQERTRALERLIRE
ncbi:phosphomannomutase [Ectothiorhodospira mobilis]|uniref:phosphomannomutase n=1 Tax=Ectothiorhodospira mobilis TaxID=195064 RepID=A0A1I4QF74_ECTMO|nr:phosphomannomutase [Ectothiorhodospira mobilis]SFM38708.1 phosphomannomutase [Ectothiorhodospira mobilis]